MFSKRPIFFATLLIIVLCPIPINQISAFSSSYPCKIISQIEAPPVIDGFLNESSWLRSDRADYILKSEQTLNYTVILTIRSIFSDSRMYFGINFSIATDYVDFLIYTKTNPWEPMINANESDVLGITDGNDVKQIGKNPFSSYGYDCFHNRTASFLITQDNQAGFIYSINNSAEKYVIEYSYPIQTNDSGYHDPRIKKGDKLIMFIWAVFSGGGGPYLSGINYEQKQINYIEIKIQGLSTAAIVAIVLPISFITVTGIMTAIVRQRRKSPG